eukprot:Blabericola_migrator_1__3108@NODE_1902_length_3583_cov_116_253697_g608_i2_p2_GENE_NODE_1902_length_3583_cov_116_253697_g608_i2NODE_1902_length_3583_cov_116_253697_g608_i2_p2_ORF_typecomplete_len334_score79_17DNA_pol3_delta2/PF13177_6/4_9e28Rad17/PF03215_15/9_9e13AAA/PF00004_29/2_9e11Rep_fac_C/PF08542_11/2e10RuvB_N/PF05496_12/2_9e09AAA_22/PF13401_6/5_8e07DNA_pol3_delta/PF06144_13/7e07AAA_30/PF13604_6/1_7e06IstB_IS21/PF01695_17/4e06AAA_19/PF13245_6/1_2e05AAA_2/PF07724_14/1_3e05AAA_14/PF13173_6/3_5
MSLWIEKYRPASLDDVAHHQDVIMMLKQVKVTGSLPHLIFYGPAGTGKTSTILAFAREVFGPKWRERILELNASDERGIDMIRERVKTWSKLIVNPNTLDVKAVDMEDEPRTVANYKILILDEGDMLTVDAQSALRRIMEDTSKQTRFVIICNYVSKIIDALVSRCVSYRFQPIPEAAQKKKLAEICQAEGVVAEEKAIDQLIEICKGDLRRSISLLQMASHSRETITTDIILKAAGYPPLRIVDGIWTSVKARNPFETLRMQAEQIVQDGWDVSVLMEQFVQKLLSDENMSDAHKSKFACVIAKTSRCLIDGASEKILLINLVAQMKKIMVE